MSESEGGTVPWKTYDQIGISSGDYFAKVCNTGEVRCLPLSGYVNEHGIC